MRPYDGEVPGASLLMLRDGAPIVKRAWGLANLEDRTPATPATNYRLASVTKQFTAAAVLLLVQDRKLALDVPIGTWLRALPERPGQATVRQLLTHTSGIVDYEDLIPTGATGQLRDADVLKLLGSRETTYFAPGTRYRYSNSGYALLALIVERVSGDTFAEFLRSRVLAPLGMSSSVAHQEGVSSVSNRAFGYAMKDGAWIRNDQSVTSAVLGDGGIYSSIDDLAKWDAALYDDRLLSDESRRLAFTAQTETSEAGVSYGFGWRITGDTVWHSGETAGFRNVIVRYPSRRTTIVILTNRDHPEPYDSALTLAEMIRSPHSRCG